MRQLVWASLPLEQGKILDAFAGVGSTLSAAESLGYDSVGIEINEEYVQIAHRAVSKLAKLVVNNNQVKQSKANIPKSQLSLPLFENLSN
jgi:site-specific DNA-methyltransferase (adenine-specific)